MPTRVKPAGGGVRLGRGLLWLVFALGLLAGALLITWQAWSAADFGYRYWHGALAIDRHIEDFGPQNRYRRGFETTTVEERARLFGAIVDAINGAPETLAGLRYHAPGGRVLGRLLRPPEIEHLQDVARLIAVLRPAGFAGAILAVAIATAAALRRWPLPGLRAFAGGAVGVLAVGGLLLVVMGPTHVFYALHVWIFPADHQWFFFYQESLMSTLMKAPDLFGAIAAEWLAAALLLFTALLALQRRLHRAVTAR